MKRMARVLKAVLRHLKDTRGVSLYEITAAVAMTGILAAVAVPVIIEKTSEAKVARVGLEANNIAEAISAFRNDTKKAPGEVEGVILLLSGPQGFFALLPANSHLVFNVPGVTITATGVCTPAGHCANMNDYLVRDPNRPVADGGFGPLVAATATTPAVLRYPNWRGPYVDEIFIDQFDRSYIVNMAPLYKLETPPDKTCGFGWVISGGPDRTLSTRFDATTLDPATDDIGKNTGKKIGLGNGCVVTGG